MSERTPSPRLEDALRTVGIWVTALMLPFILLAILGRLAVGLVFPEWARRSDSAKRARRAEMREWQELQLQPYRAKTFAELCALPPRIELTAPEKFQGHRFTVERKAGDEGGVEVAVRASQRIVWPFWAFHDARFEMLNTGEIVKAEPYDDSE